jgi:hypothetical protein
LCSVSCDRFSYVAWVYATVDISIRCPKTLSFSILNYFTNTLESHRTTKAVTGSYIGTVESYPTFLFPILPFQYYIHIFSLYSSVTFLQALSNNILKMAVFWDVASCSLVHFDRCFEGAYCLHHQGDEQLVALMMEAISISETSVNIYQKTQRSLPEYSHLHTCSRQNLKSHPTKSCFAVLTAGLWLSSYGSRLVFENLEFDSRSGDWLLRYFRGFSQFLQTT